MLRGANPVLQAFLGTLMTWGITALGASFVFVTKKRNRKLLDVCLGFAAGVMTAASFWSLLAPGIEMAENSGLYGPEGQWRLFLTKSKISKNRTFLPKTKLTRR